MRITVFTSTYNRATYLPKLFESLRNQQSFDFEWIIVDDGSIDDTESIISEMINYEGFPITYIKKENGGKHTAINIGLKIAKGDYFFIVDSDDYLLPDAISKLKDWTSEIDKDKSIVGVCGRCVYPDMRFIGSSFDFKPTICNSIEIRQKYKVKGDLSEVFKTSILKEYLFPVYTNESFMSEALVWNRLANDGYKIKYYNIPIKVCEYLAEGLSRNIRRSHRNSPKGTMLYYNEIISSSQQSLLTKIKAVINYWRYTPKINHHNIDENLRPHKWYYLLRPIGLYFYQRDID